MSLPAVTAVVPTRNRATLLARTLGSVLAQRDVQLEVVVIDEASTDATPALLAGLGDRVRVVRHDVAKGLPTARNAGLAQARHPWVAFCDDDDVWAPDKLAAQVAACLRDDASWCAAGSVNIDLHDRLLGAHRPVGGDVALRLRAGNVVPGGGSGVLASRQVLEDLGGFDTSLRAAEDYDMWVRLAQRSPLAAVDRPLVGYRMWPGTMSTDVARQREQHALVLARHGSAAVDVADRRAADLRFQQYLARHHLRRGDRLGAFRAYFSIAVAHRQPTHVVHAVTALVAPVFAERVRAAKEHAEIPTDYAAQAAAWLGELRPLVVLEVAP